jgi:hypothetical protein
MLNYKLYLINQLDIYRYISLREIIGTSPVINDRGSRCSPKGTTGTSQMAADSSLPSV